MPTLRTPAAAALLVLAAMPAGCRKTFDLTIINHTARTRAVEVETSAEGFVDLGPLGPSHSVRYTLKIDKDLLPETLIVKAGDQVGRFVLDRRTAARQWIDIHHLEPMRMRGKKVLANARQTGRYPSHRARRDRKASP